jgi:hypothetical protein
VNDKGEIVARVKGWRGPIRASVRASCFLEPVPDDYDPIAAGDGAYTAFVRGFLRDMYPRGDVPPWAIDALTYAGVDVRGGSGGEG